MSSSDDRPGTDEPTTPAWGAQPPTWYAPGQGHQPGYGQAGQQPGYGHGGEPGYGSHGDYGQQQWYGQQQGQPQPQGWGPPPHYAGYAGYAAQETESKAIVALVLSIVSFVVCPLVPAIVALVLASSSQRAIEASGGRLTGLGIVKAARIVSWVNIGLTVAGVVLFVIVFAAVGTSEFESTTYSWRP